MRVEQRIATGIGSMLIAVVFSLGVVFHGCGSSELTVKDAQRGLQLACETLATVLQAQHSLKNPDAWQLALEACNVERTTKIMDVLLTARSEDRPHVQSIDLMPSPFVSTVDAGPTPAVTPSP